MQCIERPEHIEVRQRPDGLAECFIRRNIRQVADAEGNTAYEADEVQFVGSYTLSMVEQNEEALWRMHNPAPVGERMADAERIQAEQDDAIIALYEMIGA